MNEVLHHAVLLGHVTLEVDELAQDVLVVGFHRSETGGHLIVTSGEVIDLALHGFECADIFDGRGGDDWGYRRADVAC